MLIVSVDLRVDFILHVFNLGHERVEETIDISSESASLLFIQGEQFVSEDHLLFDSFNMVVNCVVRLISHGSIGSAIRRKCGVAEDRDSRARLFVQGELPVLVL